MSNRHDVLLPVDLGTTNEDENETASTSQGGNRLGASPSRPFLTVAGNFLDQDIAVNHRTSASQQQQLQPPKQSQQQLQRMQSQVQPQQWARPQQQLQLQQQAQQQPQQRVQQQRVQQQQQPQQRIQQQQQQPQQRVQQQQQPQQRVQQQPQQRAQQQQRQQHDGVVLRPPRWRRGPRRPRWISDQHKLLQFLWDIYCCGRRHGPA